MSPLIFQELNVSPALLKAVEKMGFREATPVQESAIGPMLAGKDLIAQAPTGTGKTCAFGIPMIERIDCKSSQVQAVVLCPTRELAIQTAEELSKLAAFQQGIKIIPVYGGQPIERQLAALRKRPQIVVATPGRLMDHLRRKTVKIHELKLLVLDEADEMLNMGFREDIDTILETVPKERQTALFSATLSPEIMEIAHTYLKEDVTLIRETNRELTVPTIDQYYLEVRGQKKTDVLMRLLDTNRFRLSMVFCNTKKMADQLTKDLIAQGYRAEALHGDMKQIQRDRVMNRFRKGVVEILVATDVAARGLDVDDIDAVFNYDLPVDVEYYVHRIGRTGRAKRTGASFSFVSGRENYKLREIMKYTCSEIKLFQAPTAQDVFALRAERTLKKAQERLEGGLPERYTQLLEDWLKERPDYSPAALAAALLSLSVAEESGAESGSPKETAYRTGGEAGMTRMFFNVGTLDKIRPRHLAELICKNTTVKESLLGHMDIFDKFSFAEVPYEAAAEVAKKVSGQKYKGRTVVAQPANQKLKAKKRS